MTPDQHQKVRRYCRDLGVVQSQEALVIQVNQAVEILNACGLYDAADQLVRQSSRRIALDMVRADL